MDRLTPWGAQATRHHAAAFVEKEIAGTVFALGASDPLDATRRWHAISTRCETPLALPWQLMLTARSRVEHELIYILETVMKQWTPDKTDLVVEALSTMHGLVAHAVAILREATGASVSVTEGPHGPYSHIIFIDRSKTDAGNKLWRS